MKKILGSKAWTAAGITVVFLGLIGLIVLGLRFFLGVYTLTGPDVLAGATYSIDGGEWKTVGEDGVIDESFDRIEVKFTLPAEVVVLEGMLNNINISAKNVWYELKLADSDEDIALISVHSTSREEMHRINYKTYMQLSDKPDDPLRDWENFKEYDDEILGPSLSLDYPKTPGYTSSLIETSHFMSEASEAQGDLSFVLIAENPYKDRDFTFHEAVRIFTSGDNGYYVDFFINVLPALLLFVLVCFFGIFLFPIAGFILGKINYRYLTFGFLCLFWGLFMIIQRAGDYINLWIYDSIVCMTIHTLLSYFLIITILFYLKSNLTKPITRAVANVTATLYILAVAAVTVSQFAHGKDLYETAIYMHFATVVSMLVLAVLLFIEAKGSKQVLQVLIAWTPLTLSVIVDALNHYLSFTKIHFYYFGLAITMFYQIISMILDLRRQYKEAIRFREMEKELYESKVNVMVSQIQPHFMYNALTSISMMCVINPETAQEATDTFAKYLRGNMDSLKVTTPVPFERELEHLENYLYIEKLRFGKKLNVEYDIEAKDFVLPLLSIQPLVENAVKHGVGMKEDGGTVTISTRETKDAFEVIISDDGVGFDIEALHLSDGRSHVGMENTKKRLESMCGGYMQIESTVNVGTTAKLVLPKAGQPEDL